MRLAVHRSVSSVAHGKGGGMRSSVKTIINAAHRLPGTLLHGHTYRITASMDMARDSQTGLTISFDAFLEALKIATNRFDHDQLERTLAQLPATAENLAECVARSMCKTYGLIVNIKVEVGEDGSVETDMYRREDGEYFSR